MVLNLSDFLKILFIFSVLLPIYYNADSGKFARIIRGDKTEFSNHPYFVHLTCVPKDHTKNITICGGTLVAENEVLTAAHCIYLCEEVFLTFNYNQSNQLKPISILEPNFAWHENYDTTTNRFDVAIITIPDNRIDEIKKIIHIYVKLDGSDSLHTKEIAVVIGYGTSDIDKFEESNALLHYEGVIIDNEKCKQSNDYVDETKICIDLSAKGQTSCNGDSGGPVFIDGVQIGIVSYGNKSCDKPSVNVRVSSKNVRDWIKKQCPVCTFSPSDYIDQIPVAQSITVPMSVHQIGTDKVTTHQISTDHSGTDPISVPFDQGTTDEISTDATITDQSIIVSNSVAPSPSNSDEISVFLVVATITGITLVVANIIVPIILLYLQYRYEFFNQLLKWFNL